MHNLSLSAYSSNAGPRYVSGANKKGRCDRFAPAFFSILYQRKIAKHFLINFLIHETESALSFALVPFFTAEDKIIQIHNNKFQFTHLPIKRFNNTFYSGEYKICVIR